MPYKNQTDKTGFFIGSINKPGPWFRGLGPGLLYCSLDEKSGLIDKLKTYPKVENAIWLSYKNNMLCIAHERYLSAGKISSYAVADDGHISRLGNPQSSLAGAIRHLAITEDSKTLFVSSFLGGITVHNILPHRALGPAHQVIRYQGQGANPAQDKSHPHQTTISPDNRFVFVCDLGADKIWVHKIVQKPDARELGPPLSINAPSGSGPRHLIFHPIYPIFFLLGQLDGRVHAYINRHSLWQCIASHDSLPEDFSGIPEAAAIKWHPSGKTLYVSNRNSNTITVFTLENNFVLKKNICFSTMGKMPRDFAISPSGRWLIVLNLESDNVISFEISADTGLPVSVKGRMIDCGTPACIIFKDNV